MILVLTNLYTEYIELNSRVWKLILESKAKFLFHLLKKNILFSKSIKEGLSIIRGFIVTLCTHQIRGAKELRKIDLVDQNRPNRCW